MTLIKILFTFLIFIHFNAYASDEESELVADRPTFSLSMQLDTLRLELREAVKENEIRKLRDLLTRFEAIEANDSEWESWATTNHCPRWSNRQSWKNAVNSHILVMESIEPVYWNLIAKKMNEQPGRSKEINWIGAFSTAIHSIFDNHPVTCKRTSMYLLALIGHTYQSPIAQLMTANHLKILDENGQEYTKTLKILLLNYSIQSAYWKIFLDILPTTPINEEDLTQSFIKLGKDLDPSLKFSATYEEDKVNQAIEYYREAGKKGDYEGYLRAALLQKNLIRKNGADKTVIKKMLTNLKLSLILGNPDSSEEFHKNMLTICPTDMQPKLLEEWEDYEVKLTSTRPELYKEVRKLLTKGSKE
ncbi:MAG: hypothetical protein K2W94_07475 [Alphaproteobacteria bacterium]|nr:hypothetical protein [Alphaproteobacteria bacterium]